MYTSNDGRWGESGGGGGEFEVWGEQKNKFCDKSLLKIFSLASLSFTQSYIFTYLAEWEIDDDAGARERKKNFNLSIERNVSLRSGYEGALTFK